MMYITRIKQYIKGRGMEAEMSGIGPEWLGAPSDRVSEIKFETMMMCFSSMNPTPRKRIASGGHRDTRQLYQRSATLLASR